MVKLHAARSMILLRPGGVKQLDAFASGLLHPIDPSSGARGLLGAARPRLSRPRPYRPHRVDREIFVRRRIEQSSLRGIRHATCQTAGCAITAG